MTEQQVHDFMKSYENATNSYNFANVAPLLDDDAVFFFSDATLYGKENIQKAFEKTWENLGNDTYEIRDIRFLSLDEHSASIVYNFNWEGEDENWKKISWNGRGTSILVEKNGKICKIHEHLSSEK